jgi:superfamily II DNA or RNA helicase
MRHGIIGSMLSVRNCPETLRNAILMALTFENPAYTQALRFSPYGYVSDKVPKTIELAWETDDRRLVFPRGFNAAEKLQGKALRQFNSIQWEDRRVYAPVKFPKLLVCLNQDQTTLLRSFKRAKDKKIFGNHLFVAPTSAGKTIFQAAVATETGQRTLVLCYTDQIKRAWFKDLQLAFGLNPEDIGLIQQSTFRIGKQFTLASVKTLARRKHRWNELFQQIGTVILDEADVITAPSLFNFIFDCPAAFHIGATATDRSESGYGFYLRSIFGKPTKRLENKQEDTASSMRLREVEEVTTAFTFEYQQGNLDVHALNEGAMRNKERNKLIAHRVLKDWNNGRSILVVTKRVSHCKILKKRLRLAGVKNVKIITGDTNSRRKYTDEVVEGILSRKYRCIVATIDAIKLGANLNPLDSLHIVMGVKSKRNIEQLIGRIRRRADKKTTCKVVYYVDKSVPYLYGLFKWQAVPVFRKLKVERFLNQYVA